MINWSVRRSGDTLLTQFHETIKKAQARALAWAEIVAESSPPLREVAWASSTTGVSGDTCVRYTCVRKRGGGEQGEVQRKRGVIPRDVRTAVTEATRYVHEWNTK